MKPIVTLTLNPAIDGAAEAEIVRPIRKVRTSNERYGPGGGGINVARVVRELGGAALAVYLSGGVTGPVLDELLATAGIPRRRIPIADHTRIGQVVYERSSGLEFRFVPEGPAVLAQEWAACLEALEEVDCAFLVASGSLPRGVPDTFYLKVADIAARKGAMFVLDTSGAALRETLDRGVHLVKPSLGELESLVQRKLPGPSDQEDAARALIQSGAARLVALTLGRDGALLASERGILRLKPPVVEAKSAVGAGDSFVAAMTLGLAQGRSPEEAFVYGMAAGAASVLHSGTALCTRADVDRIYADMMRSGVPAFTAH
jgi:6-phosphofructokinase 2